MTELLTLSLKQSPSTLSQAAAVVVMHAFSHKVCFNLFFHNTNKSRTSGQSNVAKTQIKHSRVAIFSSGLKYICQLFIALGACLQD